MDKLIEAIEKKNKGFETVEQWEARTGKKYPDDGPVWKNYVIINRKEEENSHVKFNWRLALYKHIDNSEDLCVVANENGKPPDDWRLKE